ncbi:MAG: flavin-containing monooxygenase [Solirubrobacteraceae bacterium]
MLDQKPDIAEGSELAAALEQANLPTLLLCLAQLTGDQRWMQEPHVPTPPRGPGDGDDGGFSDELQASIRADAMQILEDLRTGALVPAPAPSPERVAEMLEISLGVELPGGYGPMLAEELGLLSRDVEIAAVPELEELHVLVIGAGFSGILAAIELSDAGVPFTVIEKDETVGGTWYENTYPGCGVDTPTHLYSLSFAQRGDWSRYFAKRGELYAYLEDVAAEHAVKEHVRFGLEVTTCTWIEDEQRWEVRCVDRTGGEHHFKASVIITGTGFFNRPAFPPIPGVGSFAGPAMHTAKWDQNVEIEGKRVGVIGTGASAMQLVPSIAGVAGEVVVFQRAAQWGIPHPNYMRSVTEATQLLMREVPHYLGWYRARLVWNFGDRLHPHVQWDPEWPHPERAISKINDSQRRFLTDYIRSELGERQDLFERCLPRYPPYGKRPLLDNGWFRTIARDDVTLVTTAIEEITSGGVRTADGEQHDLDVLVYATGFKPQQLLSPIEIRGRSGKTLREVWGEDNATAFLGITMPDFPNLFFLLGPNTFAGHGGSGILTIELEMRYTMELLKLMVERGIASVDCTREAHDAYVEELDTALSTTIWAHPGMNTYYRNKFGRIVVPMPWSNVDYWHRTRTPSLEDYNVTRR